jgi:hypothetical protein
VIIFDKRERERGTTFGVDEKKCRGRTTNNEQRRKALNKTNNHSQTTAKKIIGAGHVRPQSKTNTDFLGGIIEASHQSKSTRINRLINNKKQAARKKRNNGFFIIIIIIIICLVQSQ